MLQELIESIGQEKAKVDEEVEKGREDEESAAVLQKEVTAFQEECATDLAAAEPIIKVRAKTLQLTNSAQPSTPEGAGWCQIPALRPTFLVHRRRRLPSTRWTKPRWASSSPLAHPLRRLSKWWPPA